MNYEDYKNRNFDLKSNLTPEEEKKLFIKKVLKVVLGVSIFDVVIAACAMKFLLALIVIVFTELLIAFIFIGIPCIAAQFSSDAEAQDDVCFIVVWFALIIVTGYIYLTTYDPMIEALENILYN